MEFVPVVYVLVFSLMYFRHVDAQQCPTTVNGAVRSFGDSCQYKCRCNDVIETCNQTTGECLSGCATGWMGAGCQYKNVAINQPVSQTGTLTSGTGASMAVDGDRFTCSVATSSTMEPIWTVGFADMTLIVGVVIMVPDNEPLHDFAVLVRNDSDTEESEEEPSYCYWQSVSADPTSTNTRHDITCFQPLQGRYLTIVKRSPSTQLSLCEVQVYGGRELAFKKASTLSSIIQSTYGAANANDGSDANSNVLQCSITRPSVMPTWAVDLGATFTIHQIVVHLASGAYSRNLVSGFRVTVSGLDDNALFTYNDAQATPDAMVVINLPQPVNGQHVEVLIPGDGTQRQLILCEVEVFGDCPIDRCSLNCSTTCMCNTTVTGDNKISSICPYGCSYNTTSPYQQCDNVEVNTVSTLTPEETVTLVDPDDYDTGFLPVDGTCPSEGSILSFGAICQYRCRCYGNEQCNNTSGICPGGYCAAGWSGSSCQYANIAYNRLASQSSTYERSAARFANDAYGGESCSRTQTEDNAWWSVDLGLVPRYITGCTIITPFPRGGLEDDWPFFNSFFILISNDSSVNSPDQVTCYSQANNTEPRENNRLTFTCSEPIKGRYLIIQQNEEKEVYICDFVVTNGRELAFRKPTTLSTTLESDIIQDGCFSTQVSENPYWMVDLRYMYRIQRILIHFPSVESTRALQSSFRVEIALDINFGAIQFFYEHGSPDIDEITEVLLPEHVDGRYVRIQLPGVDRRLELCSVDVFGDEIEVPEETSSVSSVTSSVTAVTDNTNGITEEQQKSSDSVGTTRDDGMTQSPTASNGDGATVPSSAITIFKIHRVQLYYFSLIMVAVRLLIRMNMS